MTKQTESKSNKIPTPTPNPACWYYGHYIVKIWEKYLKSDDNGKQNIKFEVKNHNNNDLKIKDTIFNGLTQIHEVALVLQKSNDTVSLYTNHKDQSLTLCGEIGTQLFGEIGNQQSFNNIEDAISNQQSFKNIEEAIQQIKTYNDAHPTLEEQVTDHLIIFPYHKACHWYLGNLTLSFSDNQIAEAKVGLIDPLKKLTSECDDVINKIKSLDSFKKLDLEITKTSINRTKQQNDGASCGPITAENGKEFIKADQNADIEKNFLNETYLTQADVNSLRTGHMELINDDTLNINLLNPDASFKEGTMDSIKSVAQDSRLDSGSSFTPDGLKKTLHGNVYQLALLTLAAIRAHAKKLKFFLVSEAKEFEKFDDLVIDSEDKIIYLQAKHSSSENQTYSVNDFCSGYKNDASLAKYFDSWYKLKNSQYSKTKELANSPKISQYIFFTNKGVRQDVKSSLQETKIDKDEFLFQSLHTQSFKFKNSDSNNQFIASIKAYSKEIPKSSNSNSDPINLDLFTKHVQEAKTYLQRKKFNEFAKKGKGIQKIDGSSKLTFEARALIALVKTGHEKVIQRVIGKDCKDILHWIKEVKVQCDNPLAVLRPKMTKEIKEFLDEFIIKIEQPNRHDLEKIILDELGKIITIGVKEFKGCLNEYMWKWLADHKECLLKSESFDEFINITNNDFSRFYFLGTTSNYQKECEASVVHYTDLVPVDGLHNFLTPTVNQSTPNIAMIKDQGGGVKFQIYQTIKKIENLKDDEWSFLLLSSDNIALLFNILSGTSSKFYIIDCRLETGVINQYSMQLKQICKKAIDQNKKLILLIDGEYNAFTTDLATQYASKIVEYKSEPLTDNQIIKICKSYNDKYVSLASKKYQIAEIIENKIGSIYQLMHNTKYLIQILKTACKERQKIESELPYGVYIPNQMLKGEACYDLSIITSTIANCYIFVDIDYTTLSKKINKYFQDDQEQIKSFSYDIKDYDSKNIVLTEKPLDQDLVDRKYIVLSQCKEQQFKIIDNPEHLSFTCQISTDFSYKATQEQFIKQIISGNQLSVLMSPAGYGKTAFCKNIVEQHRSSGDKFSPIWIIKIPLSNLPSEPKFDSIVTQFLDGAHEWQKEAWKQDQKVSGRVLIILDGFDEIKNVETVKSINEWIKHLSKNTALIITTRKYAANKIETPLDKDTTIYQLTEYTDNQRTEYIKQYIKAILQETEETEKFNSFVEYVTQKIKDQTATHVSKVLGIPLESYIFCELCKPYILSDVKQNGYIVSEKSLDIFENIDVSNIANLYQEFILSKSRVFLEKHLGITPETVINKSILFNLMGSYNQIIELYALLQAFGLHNEHKITLYKNSINFDVNALKTLEDTGLLRVLKDDNSLNKENIRLNFNHETYQEFYAALAIMRGILSDKGALYEIVKSLIIKHRYDPKFHLIFSIASQFSISAGPMIPGYNIEKHLLSFWNLLVENGDVLGVASIKLFKCCVSDFTQNHRDHLLKKLEQNKDCKFLKVAINSCKERLTSDEQEEEEEDELPISSQQTIGDEDVDTKYNNAKINTDKDFVANNFRYFRKKGLSNEHIECLKKAAEENNYSSSYWWLDGGIEAIGCVGKLFDEKLSKYLSHRAKLYTNNERLIIKTITSIYRDLNANPDCDDARKNCFAVIKDLLKLIIEKYDGKIYKPHKNSFLSLLNLVNVKFLDDLNNELQEKKNSLDQYDLKSPLSSIEPQWDIIQIILLVAQNIEYGVLISESDKKITLMKDISIELNTTNQIFGDIISDLFNKQHDPSRIEISKKTMKFENSLRKKAEEYFIEQLKNEDFFDIYFKQCTQHINYERLLYLYKKLSDHEVITKYHVTQYTEDLNTKNATTKDDQDDHWSLNDGMAIAGDTGIYFYKIICDYLKSCQQHAKEGLNRIYGALTASDIDKSQKAYNVAVEAYNKCIIDDFPALTSITQDRSSNSEHFMSCDMNYICGQHDIEHEMHTSGDTPSCNDSADLNTNEMAIL